MNYEVFWLIIPPRPNETLFAYRFQGEWNLGYKTHGGRGEHRLRLGEEGRHMI